MTRSVRLIGCKDPAIHESGKVGYITLQLDDTSEPELEIQISLPSAAGPLIGRILQMTTGAATAQSTTPSAQASEPIGIVPIAPQKIGLALSGPGQVVLSLQFGNLHLNFPILLSELQRIADFLSTEARKAAMEPGAVQ